MCVKIVKDTDALNKTSTDIVTQNSVATTLSSFEKRTISDNLLILLYYRDVHI